MFGVTPYSILRGHGTPWMVGTRALDVLSVQKHLLELSALEFAVMREQYNFLFNMVDDRNEASKRWLQWLGFTLLEPIMYGPDRVSFRQFYWERKCSSH